MIEHDCHCGPGWFPKWLKRVLSKRFNGACAVHDYEYRLQEIGKWESDEKFLDAMIQMSESRKELIQAYLFFIMVKCFGWFSWHKNKIENLYRRGE